MNPRGLVLVALCLVALFSKGVLLQGLSHYGLEFNTAFMSAHDTDMMGLLVSTQEDHTVSFDVSDINGYIDSGNVSRNNPQLLILPALQQVRGSGYSYRQSGVRVNALSPISVVTVSFQGDLPRLSFLSLPHQDLSLSEYTYFSISSSNTNSTWHSQILLIADRDNTSISIIPSWNVTLPLDPQMNDTATVPVRAGDTYTATLHQYHTLLIADNGDLSGTRITSSSPLTVISGHECGEAVPMVGYDCDAFATQIPPTITWSNNFLLVPLQTENGQMYKVVSSEANVLVNSTCGRNSTQTVTLSSAGDTYSLFTNSSVFCSLTCSQRCYVAEFGLSSPTNAPFLTTVISIVQYPHNVTMTPLLNNSLHYSIAVPADEYFNRTVIINGSPLILDWSPIYDSSGTITGYGSDYNPVTGLSSTTIAHGHPNGRLYVVAYGTDGGYGYVAGTLLEPNIPAVRFSANEYCVLEDIGGVNVVLQRLADIDVNFLIQMRFDANVVDTNSTVIEFLPGEMEKSINFDVLQFERTESIRLIAELFTYTNLSNTIVLDETVLLLQDVDSGITIGFKEREQTVIGSSTLVLEVLLNGNDLKCLIDGPIVLLLQLQNTEGYTVNVTRLEFNQYVSEYTVQMRLDRLLSSLNLNTDDDQTLMGNLIVSSSGGFNITLEHPQVAISYISSPTDSSSVISPTITFTVNTVTAIPTQTVDPVVKTLLNPTTAYVIGVSTTIFTAVVCSFVIVAAFICGRYCKQKKRQSLDSFDSGPQERQGYYVMKKPYNLTQEITGDFANRARADSRRRPPPLPPVTSNSPTLATSSLAASSLAAISLPLSPVASRPLPALPIETEVYENVHKDDEAEQNL